MCGELLVDNTPATKFAVGERVRFVDTYGKEGTGKGVYGDLGGKVGVITEYDFDGPRVALDDLKNDSFDGSYSAWDDELELVA